MPKPDLEKVDDDIGYIEDPEEKVEKEEEPKIQDKQELYCDNKKIGMTKTCEKIGFENGLPIFRITGELFKGFENVLDKKHLITLENDRLTVKLV